MFAGGTGISPFRGFIQARSDGENVLFYSVRRAPDLLYRDELDDWVRRGVLDLHVAVTQDDIQVTATQEAGIVDAPGDPTRVTDLIETHAERLWDLVGDDCSGVVYICGQAGFAHAVVEGLRGVASARSAAEGNGEAFVRRLLGARRIRMDVFTTTAPLRAPGPLGGRTVPASELVTRNDDNAGFWMAIDGAVYDVTEFRHLHPGGSQIIMESAGTDASEEYRAVLHDLNPEVGAMLSMYKVGLMQRLRLGSTWRGCPTSIRAGGVA